MWVKAPDSLSLKTGVVDIWKVDLVAPPRPLEFYESLISLEEKVRADRFYFEKDRSQFIVGRANLRLLLGRYLQVDAQAITFDSNDFGKPTVANPLNLNFNISHSGGLAIMGFTIQSEIGIDLEKIKRDIDIELIASRFFAPLEKEQILNLSPDKQANAFYRTWTSKEAFIKAHGQGLSLPLDQFEVEVMPEKKAALKAVHWAPKLINSWDIFAFIPQEEFMGAVVCNRKIEELVFYSI